MNGFQIASLAVPHGVVPKDARVGERIYISLAMSAQGGPKLVGGLASPKGTMARFGELGLEVSKRKRIFTLIMCDLCNFTP